MKSLRTALFVLLAAAFSMPQASADPDKSYDAEYAGTAGRRLERGVSNTMMGWMEIPREITQQGKENGVAAACLWGPVKGLGQAVARTGAGVFETVTFALPAHPVPPPLTQPDFVLDKDSTKRYNNPFTVILTNPACRQAGK